MNNPHVAFLSKLFEENQLVSGLENTDKKVILVVVDKSLASEDLEQVTQFFSNQATVKFIHISSLDDGNNI